MNTQIIRNAHELADLTLKIHQNRQTIALVPTMGYLHDGHASLIRAARNKADFVIVSDFVNPTQFGPNEDFETYPRDEQADLLTCQNCGADVLFIPSVDTLYPNGQDATWVEVPHLGHVLCGASRPGHFRGVTTVVSKLLWLSRADFAFFGEKDYQQLTIIKRMVQDLGCPCQIIGMPLVRENDGLALSSRNVRLSPSERSQALSLSRALKNAAAQFKLGERNPKILIENAKKEINAQPDAQIDYIVICNPDTLDILDQTLPEQVIMLMAVRVGNVRLIDNMRLDR